MPFKSEKQRRWMHANEPEIAKDWEKKKENVEEKKERDYKAEYKKFQSSTKAKKYRAELNKYNRKKGTYGNGDGKDASHKGGKIVGFESQSKNRGRAEKSRLKKEGVITENPAAIAAGVRAAMARAKEKELAVGGGKKVKVSTALANKSHPKHKQAKGIIQRIKDKAKSMLAKTKKKKAEPKKLSKGDANFYARQFGGKVESVNEDLYYGYYKDKKVKVNAKSDKDAKKQIISKLKIPKGDLNRASMINHTKNKQNKHKFESVNEANNIDKIKDIVKKKSYKRIGGVIVDMQTANAILKVYKALNTANRKKYEKLSIAKMADVAWKLIK